MKKLLTDNLKKFIFVTILITLSFFTLLTIFLDKKFYIGVGIITVLFALGMTFNGYTFGENDWEEKDMKIDLGFMYHLSTFLIVNTIGFIWVYNFDRSEIYTDIIGFSFWLIGLVIHYFASKKSLKGIPSGKVFP